MKAIKQYTMLHLNKRPILVRILTVSAFDMISKMTSVVLFILLIRILTKDDYARLTYFNSVAFFMLGAIGVGISSSYVRFESERVSRLQPQKTNLYLFYILFITLIYFLIILAGIIIYLQPAKSFRFNINDFKVVLFGVLYSFPLSIQNMNEAYYQVRENFKRAGFIFYLKNLAVLICILAAALFMKLELAFILGIYIMTSFGIALNYLVKILGENKILRIDLHEIKENLRSSAWLIIYCFFLALFTQMDVFMVSARQSEDMLANYGVASKYYSLLLTLLPSIMTVLKVRTSKPDIIDDVGKQKEYILNWIRGITPVVVLVVGIISLSSPFLFPILNGTHYSASIPAFQILSIGVAISYIFAPNVSMIIAMRKERTLCMLGIIACIINISGNYLLIPVFGINAAASVTVLSNAIINISSTVIVLSIAKRKEKNNTERYQYL